MGGWTQRSAPPRSDRGRVRPASMLIHCHAKRRLRERGCHAGDICHPHRFVARRGPVQHLVLMSHIRIRDLRHRSRRRGGPAFEAFTMARVERFNASGAERRCWMSLFRYRPAREYPPQSHRIFAKSIHTSLGAGPAPNLLTNCRLNNNTQTFELSEESETGRSIFHGPNFRLFPASAILSDRFARICEPFRPTGREQPPTFDLVIKPQPHDTPRFSRLGVSRHLRHQSTLPQHHPALNRCLSRAEPVPAPTRCSE